VRLREPCSLGSKLMGRAARVTAHGRSNVFSGQGLALEALL